MRVALIGPAGSLSRRLAREFFDEGDEVAEVDPTEGQVSKIVKGLDVAILFGSDAETESQAASACLGASVACISSSSDPDIARAVLLTGSDQRESVVLAGCSWRPAITASLARLGSGDLDVTRFVQINWVVSSAADAGEIRNTITALSSNAVMFENGSWTRASAGTQPQRIFFPEPVGWRTVRVCRGAEVDLLPEMMTDVETVLVKGGLTERLPDRIARMAGSRAAVVSSSRSDPVGMVFREVPLRLASLVNPRGLAWSAARVDVSGLKGGDEKSVSYGLVDHALNLASASLIVISRMVASGELSGSGARFAAEAIAPRAFLRRLRERGIRVARLEK